MTHSIERFQSLLREYAGAPDPASCCRAEKQLWESFGRRCAMLVSNYSGFTRLTAHRSIVYSLGLIQRCREAVLLPVINGVKGGSLIKTVADNAYAIFPEVGPAIEAAMGMQRAMARFNATRDEAERIGLCVGIGYGEILVIPGIDFYGHELNLAFKLGEDIAKAGEILLTEAALQATGEASYAFESRSAHVSRVTIPHAALHYDCTSTLG